MIFYKLKLSIYLSIWVLEQEQMFFCLTESKLVSWKVPQHKKSIVTWVVLPSTQPSTFFPPGWPKFIASRPIFVGIFSVTESQGLRRKKRKGKKMPNHNPHLHPHQILCKQKVWQNNYWVFSLTWSMSMFLNQNKRKRLRRIEFNPLRISWGHQLGRRSFVSGQQHGRRDIT